MHKVGLKLLGDWQHTYISVFFAGFTTDNAHIKMPVVTHVDIQLDPQKFEQWQLFKTYSSSS